MKKYIIITILITCCIKFNGYSQTNEQKPINSITATQFILGQKIPDDFWTVKHIFYRNGKRYTNDFSAYRGKIIILDFWATWCTSCITKLPMLDSIQKVYSKELVVIPINSLSAHDNLSSIEKVFLGGNKRNAFKAYDIPTIIEDKTLRELFPHRVLSHVIWIQDDIILGITMGDFLTKESIDKLVVEKRVFTAKLQQLELNERIQIEKQRIKKSKPE